MNLTEKPKFVAWPETRYVFIGKNGPFAKTAHKAWDSLHKLVPAISENNTITGYLALYKVEAQIYRAGVSIAAAPKKLPKGLEYEKFKGGKYACFTLKGPYSQLPEACGRVFEIVAEKGIKTRKNFNIENYLTDPRTTPEDKTVTEMLVPTL